MNADLMYELRHRRRLHQAELARCLGVSQVTISRWERGTRPIPVRRIPEIVRVLSGASASAGHRSKEAAPM